MQLHKAHGAGNDFVVVPDRVGEVDLTPDAVVALCDRRFGIGADGVIRLAPAADAHVFMDYRNGGDGRPVEMCGNGVRVVAAHLIEHGWTDDRELRIGTRAGVRTAVVTTDDRGRVTDVDVDMGPPSFDPDDVGITRHDIHASGERGSGRHTLVLQQHDVRLVAVSMGNPHAVIAVDDIAHAPVTTLGPAIERHPGFANGTNVEFATVTGRRSVELRVWERGVGETLACGTGVCATVATFVALDALDPDTPIQVTVPGGTLTARWSGRAGTPVHLAGPAVEVATITPSPALLRRAGLPRLVSENA